MNLLICKLGATGDVVRTSSLLRTLQGDVTWITAPENIPLLQGLASPLRCFAWPDRHLARDRKYDLVINLEDAMEVAVFAKSLQAAQVFGVYLNDDDILRYTDDARRWFDLSLISVYGREKADQLKFLNRQSYQELVFAGLGLRFEGQTYCLPRAGASDLSGDVAIAPVAGAVWPMKKWAYYDQLKGKLEAGGLRVNVLPQRPSLLEHLGDVQNHRCLVSGDSLPMHIALGLGTRCVTIFNCTSPWEIHDYGLQTKLVSPLLGEFFYKRNFEPRATTAIGLEEVLGAVRSQLNAAAR